MSQRRRTRLQTRILLWTFIPAAILLSAVAFAIFFAYQQVTEDLVVGRNQQLAHLSAAQLAANLSHYVDSLDALARAPDMYAGSPDRQFHALDNAAGQMLAFDGGMIVLTPTGQVAATTSGLASFLHQDWSDRAVFRDILRGASASYSDVIADDEGGQAFLAIAVPMLNNRGEFRGTLTGLVAVGPNRRSAFYGGIVKLRLGQNGSLFLVDGTGRVFYHANEDR
ncbi:MAG: cache domain-containing protein, partial [Anaerolineae bacterium]